LISICISLFAPARNDILPDAHAMAVAARSYLDGLDDYLEVLAQKKRAPIYRLIFSGHQVSSCCILPIALLAHSV
jgi:hypothetical protein